MEKKLIIFNYHPGLEKLPRIPLGDFPTMVERLSNIEKALGVKSEIWIKRDDLSSEIYGGNKIRKLEFLFGKMKEKGKTTCVTTGGIGSNHALAVTLFAHHLGYEVLLPLFHQPLTIHVRENLLLDYYFGAELVYGGGYVNTFFKGMSAILKWRWKYGKFPYLIPPGGSNPMGTVGFVNAVFELKEQLDGIPMPDFIFVTLGSCGTMAGLLLGLTLTELKSQLIGVRVVDRIVSNKRCVKNLAMKTWKLLHKIDPSVPAPDSRKLANFTIFHDYFGGEYGRYIPRGIEARKIMLETEGIILDGTYTSKTFAGLIDFVKENKPSKVLFWHTYNNRRKFDEILKKVDWRELPDEFHRFFDGREKVLFDF